MISLRGRRALVTGGSRGVGAATALLLAECGADVGIGYRSREDAATAVVRQLAERGVKAFAHAADLSTPDGAQALADRAEREFGGLDIFVANAGVWPAEEAAVQEMEDARWRHTMAQDLDAIFFSTRAVLRQMGNGGRIVIIGSTAGQRGEAMHADYAAAKGAVIAFVKSIALEVASRDITVNCVAPGWIDTDMVSDAFKDGGRERIAASIPLGRVATPRDVAGPVAFLCSELARHITGEVLNVNGGSVLCG